MSELPSTGAASRPPPRRPAEPRLRGIFWPLLLPSLAFVAWLAGQAVQLVQDRQNLQRFSAGQQAQVDNANRLRASLDRLAVSTQQLANEGNANARRLVDELQRRGVTINPAQAGAPR